MFNIIALSQWELGKVITNPLLVKGDRVIFRSATGATFTMLSGVGTVAVPNALLQYAVPFVVEREGHPEGRTKFTVTAQPKPVNYVFENNVPDICGIGLEDLDAELRGMLSGGSGGGGMVIDFDNLPSDKKAFWESIRDAINAGIPVDGYYTFRGMGSGKIRLTASRVNGGQIYFTGLEWRFDYMSGAYGKSVWVYGLTLNMTGIEWDDAQMLSLA